jgi:hypothetical protein
VDQPESRISLERLLELMRIDADRRDAEEPPAHVVQRALRLFRQRRQNAEPEPRRLVARLVFDSSVQPFAAAGVRALEAGGRQLVFSADEYDLDLRISEHAVRGQVLGPCTGAVTVTLQGPVVVGGAADELCQFALDDVPPGRYMLTVVLPDVTIDAALDLGAA